MADNVAITEGSGTTIAADEVTIDGASAKVQRVKVSWGVAGSAVDASASNPFPVVQTGTPGLPTGAATAAKQPALGTAGTASTDVITVQGIASGTPLITGGNVAHDAADSGNPIKIGGKANTAAPGAVADADRADWAMTLRGAGHVSWRRNDGTEVDPDTPAQVIGTLVTVAVTPTVEATPDYSTGDVIGGIMTFATILRADTKTGYVVAVRLTSKVAAASMAAIDVYFFNASPGSSTTTENGAFSLADADRAKLLGKIAVSTWDVVGSTVSQAYAEGRVPVTGAAADDIYAVMVARGTINLGSTSDLTVAATVDQN